jgi:hypothetical protein
VSIGNCPCGLLTLISDSRPPDLENLHLQGSSRNMDLCSRGRHTQCSKRQQIGTPNSLSGSGLQTCFQPLFQNLHSIKTVLTRGQGRFECLCGRVRPLTNIPSLSANPPRPPPLYPKIRSHAPFRPADQHSVPLCRSAQSAPPPPQVPEVRPLLPFRPLASFGLKIQPRLQQIRGYAEPQVCGYGR